MSGADMTSKFNQLQSIISTEEQTNGRTAKIIDFELQSVSNIQTDLTIGVVYGNPPPNVLGCEDWPASQFILEAGETIEECVLVGTNNFAWYQTITIQNLESVIDECNTLEENYIYQFDGLDVEPDGFDEAYAASQDFIGCKIILIYGPPPPPNQTHIHGPPRLVDINLVADFFSANNAFLFVRELTLGRGVPF